MLNKDITIDYYNNLGVSQTFKEAFQKFQVVHLRGRLKFGVQIDVPSLFDRLNDQDKASWCVETSGVNTGDKIQPKDFLDQTLTHMRGYCSFLVQKDALAFKAALEDLPIKNPLPGIAWHYFPNALWFFVGRNPLHHLNLQGRPEHTDSICNDGTWHLQLSGQKTWFLRPTPQLWDRFKKLGLGENDCESMSLRIDCNQGDVLCVNTRLWFHSTMIPAQETPSVSYARDFYFEDPNRDNDNAVKSAEGKSGMTNLDGLYARKNIEEGTVICTEKDMPDCELQRSSTNPNCAVIEMDDGTSALVSLRAITAGDFFCVVDSDDEAVSEEDNE